MFQCYLIFKDNLTYIGITNNLKRTIKQHNAILKGGAKYTKINGPGWSFACYVSGFKNKCDALKFEWAFKHINRKNGLINKIKNLETLLNKNYWTSKSPPSKDYKLTIHWCGIFLIPENINIPKYISQDVDFSLN